MYIPIQAIAVALLLGGMLAAGCRPGQAPTTQPQRSAAVEAAEQRHEYRRYLMGVQARFVVYAKDDTTAEQATMAAIRRIAALEDVSSDYRAGSEAMRLCAKAGGAPIRISEDLFLLLQRSREIARWSQGQFDPTIGPLVRLWRQSRQARTLPDAEALRAARALVGWEKIEVDEENRTARLAIPGMKLDFGGIAKGYAADLGIAELRKNGIGSALVELGGDIVVSAPPPGSAGWQINVIDEKGDGTRTLALSNCAISTSGDLVQFVEIGGQRYSHVVDPRTGLGLTSRTLVTVIARDGLTADPLSTAASLVSPREARALARRYPGTRLLIRQAKIRE